MDQSHHRLTHPHRRQHTSDIDEWFKKEERKTFLDD